MPIFKIVFGATLTVIVFIMVFEAVNIFVPHYNYSYYQSPDKLSTVTKIDYDGHTYITYGRFSADSIPENYIQPRYAGIGSGFEAILYFEKGNAIIYANTGVFDSVGINKGLHVISHEYLGWDTLYRRIQSELFYGNSEKYQVIHN
ncbi:MAG: hypothetical protein JKY70_05325 [Mucilaginibacter sp.]|nr:hypothetical protein [Mucilaginibacter sp.]